MPDSATDFPTALYEIYEGGKVRRYNLLFAVNGGAFAIFEVFINDRNSDVTVLAGWVPWGMIIFTLAMFVDIWSFGQAMRSRLKGAAFTLIGKAISVTIGALLISGWFLYAAKPDEDAVPLLLFIVLCVLLPILGAAVRRYAGHRQLAS